MQKHLFNAKKGLGMDYWGNESPLNSNYSTLLRIQTFTVRSHGGGGPRYHPNIDVIVAHVDVKADKVTS